MTTLDALRTVRGAAVADVQRRGAVVVLLSLCAAAVVLLLRRVDVVLAVGGAVCIAVAAFHVSPVHGWAAVGGAMWFVEWRLDPGAQ